MRVLGQARPDILHMTKKRVCTNTVIHNTAEAKVCAPVCMQAADINVARAHLHSHVKRQ